MSLQETLAVLHLVREVLKDEDLYFDTQEALIKAIQKNTGVHLDDILKTFSDDDDEDDGTEEKTPPTHLDAFIQQMNECDCAPQPFYRVVGYGTNPERIKAAADERAKKAVDKFLASIMGDLK